MPTGPPGRKVIVTVLPVWMALRLIDETGGPTRRVSWNALLIPFGKVTGCENVTVKLVTMDRCAEPSLTCTDETVDGGGVGWTSTAPMSAAGPDTRTHGAPRWSEVSPAGLAPLLIAGLPA